MVAKQPFQSAPLAAMHLPAEAIRNREGAAEISEFRGSTSRRDLLGALALAPLATVSMAEVGAFGLPCEVVSDLVPLRRSRNGRHLSRVRYHNAEGFFAPVEQGSEFRQSDQLYQVGIALQLALSSHLLDVGFADAWCAENIGLYLNKSLERANATGLGHDCVELKALAEFLSPYGRWRNADVTQAADTCPFSRERICRITRALLERVREVTGHSRPPGRERGRRWP
jgi:hypothetical protein